MSDIFNWGSEAEWAINAEAYEKEKGKLGREHLIANGFPKDKALALPDLVAWDVSRRHVNAFLGIE